MTCACGFHLNPPNPCQCDGKRPECDKQETEIFFCLEASAEGGVCGNEFQCESCKELDRILDKLI